MAFRNNLILAPAGCPLVAIDHDSDAIIFQGNLYWAGGGPFKTTGAKACDSLEAWRKTGKETIGGKAVGLFADPRLDLAAPRGQDERPDAACQADPVPTAVPDPPRWTRGSTSEALFKLDLGGQDILGTRIPVGNAPDVGAVETRNRAGKP